MRALQFVVSALLVSFPAGAAAAPVACDTLSALALPNTKVTEAQAVAAGGFRAPGAGGGRGGAETSAANPYGSLPAFCRIAATLTPSSDSDIKVEVWMPTADWNGKFLAVGNGGWTGSIAYAAMRDALARGYATASTDTGHVGGSASFAPGHPEKVIDFGYRSIHEMTVVAKRVVSAYYGNAPRFSYFNGCSAGGRQGLKEAQRYPADYDGIVAGAPASDWTGRAAQSLRVWQALHKDPASDLPAAKYPLVHDAVLNACDQLDGVKDGVLEQPRRCRFDPAALACKGGDGPDCLTPAQVESVRQIYAAAKNPQSGRELSGLEPGSELGWATWGGPQPFATSVSHFKDVVFNNPQWDPVTFNFTADVVRAEQADGNTINALDPNLKPFFDRGGKLIQYHGWSDPQIAPGSSVQYYERVLAAVGNADLVQRNYRLFMVPGMAHCGGGEGPNSFDALAALEAWVEQGKPPDMIVAERRRQGQVDRTRPLCPYPQVAVYNGTGSTDTASSFTCKAP